MSKLLVWSEKNIMRGNPPCIYLYVRWEHHQVAGQVRFFSSFFLTVHASVGLLIILEYLFSEIWFRMQKIWVVTLCSTNWETTVLDAFIGCGRCGWDASLVLIGSGGVQAELPLLPALCSMALIASLSPQLRHGRVVPASREGRRSSGECRPPGGWPPSQRGWGGGGASSPNSVPGHLQAPCQRWQLVADNPISGTCLLRGEHWPPAQQSPTSGCLLLQPD